VFVNSMSDLFHQGVTDKFLAQVWAVMAATPQHTYQVLTKRHARMRSLLQTGEFFELVLEEAVEALGLPGIPWPLPNVWVGVSVEDQKRADLRIPALLDTPAAVRFLSCEPLLGPVDLWSWLDCPHDSMSGGGIPGGRWRCDHCAATCHDTDSSPGLGPYRPGLHWVITGGESGHGARPMHPAWARHLHHQCAAAGVAFFFKQTGSVLARRWGCSDPKGHHRAEWPEPFPREYPHAA
jgi:protein gp37